MRIVFCCRIDNPLCIIIMRYDDDTINKMIASCDIMIARITRCYHALYIYRMQRNKINDAIRLRIRMDKQNGKTIQINHNATRIKIIW